MHTGSHAAYAACGGRSDCGAKGAPFAGAVLPIIPASTSLPALSCRPGTTLSWALLGDMQGVCLPNSTLLCEGIGEMRVVRSPGDTAKGGDASHASHDAGSGCRSAISSERAYSSAFRRLRASTAESTPSRSVLYSCDMSSMRFRFAGGRTLSLVPGSHAGVHSTGSQAASLTATVVHSLLSAARARLCAPAAGGAGAPSAPTGISPSSVACMPTGVAGCVLGGSRGCVFRHPLLLRGCKKNRLSIPEQM